MTDKERKDAEFEELMKPSKISCAVCGNKIPVGRIKAAPGTQHCVSCIGESPPRDANKLCAKASDSARNGWGKSS